jgi:hypothetical protein
MKKLIIPLLLTFSNLCNGQEPAEGIFPLKEGSIYYEKVINVDSASKGEIFKRTKLWAVDAFKSQKVALQTEDKEEGFIVYKTNFTASFTMPPTAMFPKPLPNEWRFYCSVKFMIKENKCKVTIYDFGFESETYYTAKGDNSILKYRERSDPDLKKGMMSKANREKFFQNAKVTFQAANNEVLGIIDSFEKMIKSKESSDF